MALTILTTDPDLTVVGDPIVCWTAVTSVLRFNTVSSGEFTAPAHPWLLDQLEPGRRIVLIRDGVVFCAGPWVTRKYVKSVGGEDSGVGRVTVTWADDLAWIAGRVTYPNPAQDAESQTAARYDAAGNAETLMRGLVNLNAGPGALETMGSRTS